MYTRETLLAKLEKITEITGAGSGSRQEVLTAFADNLLKAIEASKHREFPNYIAQVLNSPEFTIQVNRAVVSKSALIKQRGMGAGYLNLEHHIRFNWSYDAHHLVADVIPHEFWHAYQAVLCAGNQGVRGSSISAVPYDTVGEAKELERSIKAGQERINQYHDLLKKNQAMLTLAEQTLLQTYNAAASVYVPYRRIICAPLRSPGVEFEQIIKMKQGLQVPEEKGIEFYPDRYEREGDIVVFSGFHVANPNDPGDRGLALISDTLYRENHILAKGYKSQKADLGEIPVYLMESDAYIAVNPAKFNQVFYPERNAYHKKRHCKYPYLAQLGQASSDSKAADSKVADAKAAEAKAAAAKVLEVKAAEERKGEGT